MNTKKPAPIPDTLTSFSNGKFAITVECVADLIKELKKLPPDTPVKDGVDGADLVLFNRKGPNAFVDLDDAGMWDDAGGI